MSGTTAVSGHKKSYLNVNKIRQQFPLLHQQVHGKPLVYFDNAATAQKPAIVLDTLSRYYRANNANIHRGVHTLSERATADYEQARVTVRDFIHAASEQEIIFVRGATEGINLIAQSYGRSQLSAGDEIILSVMEHHSNIVPWQLLCEQSGAVLKVIPIDNDGELIIEEYKKLLSERTKIVAVVHISNALGKINLVEHIIQLAQQYNAITVIDGAQAVPHQAVDVQLLGCDFYVFSGHKLFGPTGIGVLYGKKQLLETMPPWQGGGDMIKMVSFEKTLYNELPYKFEAGTPHIAGVIGLGCAIDYVNTVGLDLITAYEHELLQYATRALAEVKGLHLMGSPANKSSIVSFTMDNIHPHDIGTILDHEGIAIRAGHHCSMPVMQHFNVSATARASFAFYNTFEEVDIMIQALDKAREVFA